MSKLAQYWPTIRQVIYGILAAGLAVAAAAGWITSEQSDQWLAHAVTALGALGFIVAGLYVPKAPDAAPKDGFHPYIPNYVEESQRARDFTEVALRAGQQVIQQGHQAASDAAAQVDLARAKLERRLGR